MPREDDASSDTRPAEPPLARSLGARSYRYYDLLMVAFVAVYLCSNLIGPGKTAAVFGIAFSVGNIFFPISYIFGDVLTEVYGYARTRRVIWAGFGAQLFANLMILVVLALPADQEEPFNRTIQPALETVFSLTPGVTVGSILGYLVGDFTNAFVMAKMKILTKGRWLWTRTIGSTVVGQGVDSLIFYPIAFAAVWTPGTMVKIILVNWFFKVMVEVVMTPATYAVVRFLKQREGEDHYDVGADFTPFSLKV